MSDLISRKDLLNYFKNNSNGSYTDAGCTEWYLEQIIDVISNATVVKTVTLPDVAMALEERNKLGFTVVEVIEKLDEINEQLEEITLNDVNYFAVPAEMWHELQDALEEMPKRADLFKQPKVTLPNGWVAVPIEPTEEMKRALFRNLIHVDDEAYVIKAIIDAAPTCKE